MFAAAMERRAMAYSAIDREREYQRCRVGRRQPDGTVEEIPKTVGEYLVYMQHYMTQAIAASAVEMGDKAALDIIRKVTALGVACMEMHGVPDRSDAPVTNRRDNQLAL